MTPFDDDLEPIEKKKKTVRGMKLADKSKMTMHSAIESIIEITKDSALGRDYMNLAKPYVEYVAGKQSLTLNQALMFSLLVNRFYDDCISIEDLARFLNCRPFSLLNFQSDIDELEKRHFVRCSHNKGASYRIPHEVLDAVRDDVAYMWQCASNLRPLEFFEKVMSVFDERENNELTIDDTAEEIDMLIKHNLQLEFCRQLVGYSFRVEDQMLLVFYCHKFVNMHDDNVTDSDLRRMLGSRMFHQVRDQLYSDTHPLLINNMLDHAYDGGYQSQDNFRLTFHAKHTLLKELNLASLTDDMPQRDVIKCHNIEAKELFYNDAVTNQIDRLSQLLGNDKFTEIRERLQSRGFRSGFTCLFYGSPGTGKTETALQLARRTGRNVMTVNLSQLKDMYVGESEKNVKALFDYYRALVKDYPIAPILLFNEADGIFSRRMENVRHSVDQMENTIQNIILQEMENLEGILIATTNLTGNLDKAFERRFLYKIDFEKPNETSRRNIWHTMIPELDSETVETLARHYPLSGGQIENVARKLMIDDIIDGQQTATLDFLETLCRQETAISGKDRRIGF